MLAPFQVCTIASHAEAHHIVPGNDINAQVSQVILRSYPVCIGINDAINGVFLPRTPGDNIAVPRRVYHDHTLGTQAPPYSLEYVNPRILGAPRTKSGVSEALFLMRLELSGGIAHWLPPNTDPTQP